MALGFAQPAAVQKVDVRFGAHDEVERCVGMRCIAAVIKATCQIKSIHHAQRKDCFANLHAGQLAHDGFICRFTTATIASHPLDEPTEGQSNHRAPIGSARLAKEHVVPSCVTNGYSD